MSSTMEILERISQNSQAHSDEVFTRVFRYLLRPDIYFEAYSHLYANQGAATKGVDNDTADGFSEQKVTKIIEQLRNGTFQPKPTRRVYIPKANGKLRPISIPTFTDKLVQEAMRMILEAVYEPLFSNSSHGFRPNRSCHTALEQVKKDFTGVRWFVEGDIKGCFDNIDHARLIGFVNVKIKDARFIQLLWAFLKAGYLDNWRYNKTYSGTPQGGIVSPILANIYLHELDKFISILAKGFAKPKDRARNPLYDSFTKQILAVRAKIDTAEEAEKRLLLKEIQRLKVERRKFPCKSQTDKRLAYVRYADDFLVGIVGSKEDAEEIKRQLTAFVDDALNMELSAEKTLITHSDNYARFLGYDIRVRRDNKPKRTKAGKVVRTLNNKVERCIPNTDKIEKFLFSHGVVWKNGNKLVPCKRVKLIGLTDLEIVTAYNAELRGICNYYNLASNFGDLHYFSYLMEYSCLKTLACKHKTSVSHIRDKYRDGKGWSIPYQCAKGERHARLATYQDCKSKDVSDEIPMTTVKHLHSRNSFESKLKAKVCAICNRTDAEAYQIHHVHKVKDLKGKAVWEQIMIAKRRKTIVVCGECHKRIHGKKD